MLWCLSGYVCTDDTAKNRKHFYILIKCLLFNLTMFYFIEKPKIMLIIFFFCGFLWWPKGIKQLCDTNWIQATTKSHNCFQSENELNCIWFEQNEPLLFGCAKPVRGCGQVYIDIRVCVWLCVHEEKRERSKNGWQRVCERKKDTSWCVYTPNNVVVPIILTMKKCTEKCRFSARNYKANKHSYTQRAPAKRTNVRMRQRARKRANHQNSTKVCCTHTHTYTHLPNFKFI